MDSDPPSENFWLTRRFEVGRDAADSTAAFEHTPLRELRVTGARLLADGRLEVMASETWDDRLYAANGALERDLSGPLQQRYVFERVGDAWLITESQVIRSN